MRTLKDTTGLGMKFLRVGSRVPKQMVHDSRLLGKKFRRKFNKTRKNISSKFQWVVPLVLMDARRLGILILEILKKMDKTTPIRKKTPKDIKITLNTKKNMIKLVMTNQAMTKKIR